MKEAVILRSKKCPGRGNRKDKTLRVKDLDMMGQESSWKSSDQT